MGPTPLKDRRGNRTVSAFEANGNELSATNALGQTTRRTFDTFIGKQTTQTNALGHTTSTDYPSLGAAWQRLNPVRSIDEPLVHLRYRDRTRASRCHRGIASSCREMGWLIPPAFAKAHPNGHHPSVFAATPPSAAARGGLDGRVASPRPTAA